MKIMIVDDEIYIREILTIGIEGAIDGVQIVQAASGTQAVEALRTDASVDLIISDFSMPEGNGDLIQRYLREQSLNIPFVLITAYEKEHIEKFLIAPPAAFLEKPFKMDKLIETISNLVSKIREQEERGRDSDGRLYCRYRPSYLLKLGQLPADIYLRLHENKFLKIMNKGETFSQEDFEHYTEKKLDHLYLRQEDFVISFNSIAREMSKLAQTQQTVQQESWEIPVTAHQMVREYYTKIGIDDTVREMINQSISVAVHSMKGHPELKGLLNKMLSQQGEYLATHSLMLAHLVCAFASHLNWSAEITTHKLAMAAFLHDITLEDLDYEAVRLLDQKMRTHQSDVLGDPHLRKYHAHPIEAAEFFDKLKEPLPDVSVIISQHHERPDGEGFPHRLNALTISPLSAMMILGHELLDYAQVNPQGWDLGDFLNQLPASYQKGNFRAITRSLSELAIKASTFHHKVA